MIWTTIKPCCPSPHNPNLSFVDWLEFWQNKSWHSEHPLGKILAIAWTI